MRACQDEHFWPSPSLENDASGPRHISQVLHEWTRQHEAALLLDTRPKRPLPALPAPREDLACPPVLSSLSAAIIVL